MKKVIISGATGAIGMALIKKFINYGIETLVICHRQSKRKERIPSNKLVKTLECNLDELSILELGNDKYNTFYHLAWEGTIGSGRDDVYCQMRNVNYTLDAVELAYRAGCKKFIGIGSQAEYGRVDKKLKPETPSFPESAYGIAKLCAGQLSRRLCKQRKMEHIWVRVLSVYGPYDGDKTMCNTLIKGLLKGEHISLTQGKQIWDYLYSDDAARALYLLGEYGKKDKIYVLGSMDGKALKDYIEIIKNKIDGDAELGYGEVPYGKEQIMHLEADITELTKDTGFVPEISFEEGIEKTIGWIKTEIDG